MNNRIRPDMYFDPVISTDNPDLNVENFDMDQIACMPLAVSHPFKFDDGVLEQLIDFGDKMVDDEYQKMLSWPRKEIVLHSRGKTVKDFTDMSKTKQNYLDRYNSKDINLDDFSINPLFPDNLKVHVQKLLDYMHKELAIFPFHTSLTISTGPVPPHCDVPTHQEKYFNNKNYEPAQIKMILNIDEYDNTLFFTKYGTSNQRTVPPEIKYFEKEKHMPEGTNSFAWSENFHPHGAEFEDGKTFKVIVNIQGPLDKERHKKLLIKSFKKYKDFVIAFEMGNNETFIWNR